MLRLVLPTHFIGAPRRGERTKSSVAKLSSGESLVRNGVVFRVVAVSRHGFFLSAAAAGLIGSIVACGAADSGAPAGGGDDSAKAGDGQAEQGATATPTSSSNSAGTKGNDTASSG